MLPDAPIQAPNFDDWVTQAQAKDIVGVLQPHFLDVVKKYRIAHQIMFGRWVYHKGDCEAAAIKVAAMRAERAAKQVSV